MNVNICITGDYEPSMKMDWVNDMIKPTELIIRICEKYDARYSAFLDTCTYDILRDSEKSNEVARAEIGNQLKDMAARGHDVQLHFHPSWLAELGSEWTDNGWQVDLTHFRLQSLPLGDLEDRRTIRGLFKWGTGTLLELLTPMKPSYRVTCFRAGGYCIQPSQCIVKAMKEVGILADSSIWFGGYSDDGVYYYDFRKASSKYQPYYTTNDILEPFIKGKDYGVAEFPIASIAYKSRFLLRNSFSHAELCQLPEWKIKRLLLQFRENLDREQREHNFIIVTSHPKGLINIDGFRYLLENAPALLGDIAEVRFVTMREAVKVFYAVHPLDAADLSRPQLDTLKAIRKI